MIYFYWHERRTQREDQDDHLDDLLFVLDEKRWKAINFPNGIDPHPVILDGKTAKEVDATKDQIDKYFENLGKKRFVSGSEMSDEDGWM